VHHGVARGVVQLQGSVRTGGKEVVLNTVPLLPGSPDRSVSGGKSDTLMDESCAAESKNAEESGTLDDMVE
jgi:hypothetical protein